MDLQAVELKSSQNRGQYRTFSGISFKIDQDKSIDHQSIELGACLSMRLCVILLSQ